MMDSLNLPDSSTIVIGHKGIADFYDIDVLQSNVQDQKENSTHFCLIEPSNKAIHTDDTNAYVTLAFSTQQDAPGSLLNVLEVFRDLGINLTKILSRPEKSKIGHYVFYVEFKIDKKD